MVSFFQILNRSQFRPTSCFEQTKIKNLLVIYRFEFFWIWVEVPAKVETLIIPARIFRTVKDGFFLRSKDRFVSADQFRNRAQNIRGHCDHIRVAATLQNLFFHLGMEK
jgi:hypothetical protein